MDMLKFREQGELALARMWRQVALMAKQRTHVINAYQRAIEALQVNIIFSLFKFVSFLEKLSYIDLNH
jgi:hypothetical protein